MSKEQNIIQSWKANANNWISIIESGGIESRKLATNKAIIDAVIEVSPSTVLDIGCGEGWLSKELNKRGIKVTGIDIIPELIRKANEKGVGEFHVASYEDLIASRLVFAQAFDGIVINFALIGKRSTEELLNFLPSLLSGKGKLFIQTLHPYCRKSINDYVSGWKLGSWDGLGDKFVLPYQWYYRTWEDWLALLGISGFRKIRSWEVIHPLSSMPLSVIFECSIN